MSVPENARTKGKLEACVKAHDLACYTLQITTNKKNFPEQFQAALTDKIVSAALDIHTLAWSANNVLVNSPEDLAERLGYQERAVSFYLNGIERTMKLSAELRNGTYKARPTVKFTISSPKPREKVDDSYSAWRNHAGKGNTFRLLCRMDQYYINLWREENEPPDF